MYEAVRAVVGHDKKIDLLENIDVAEGTEVLVVIMPGHEDAFWQKASEASLSEVWDNDEDDIYEQLLQG